MDISVHSFIRIYCTSCGRSFDVPRPCGNRFCEICSATRARKIRMKLEHICDQVKPIPGYRIRHMVLTTPKCQDLSVSAKHLIHSFRKLRNRSWFKSRVTGGAFILEVTGSPGNWHLHIHSILQCRFLDVYKLSELWQKCSGGRIVYMKNLPKKSIIKYMTGYLTKKGCPEEYTKQVSDSLKGIRLFNTFGNWHTLLLGLKKIPYLCPCCGKSEFIADVTIQREFDECKKHPTVVLSYCGL